MVWPRSRELIYLVICAEPRLTGPTEWSVRNVSLEPAFALLALRAKRVPVVPAVGIPATSADARYCNAAARTPPRRLLARNGIPFAMANVRLWA